MLNAVFRFNGLLFENKTRIFPYLRNDEAEHRSQDCNRQERLKKAPTDDAVGYGSNAFTDDAVTDKIRQKPVGSVYGDIAKGFLNAVIREGDDTFAALPEIADDLLIGVSGFVFGV